MQREPVLVAALHIRINLAFQSTRLFQKEKKTYFLSVSGSPYYKKQGVSIIDICKEGLTKKEYLRCWSS